MGPYTATIHQEEHCAPIEAVKPRLTAEPGARRSEPAPRFEWARTPATLKADWFLEQGTQRAPCAR